MLELGLKLGDGERLLLDPLVLVELTPSSTMMSMFPSSLSMIAPSGNSTYGVFFILHQVLWKWSSNGRERWLRTSRSSIFGSTSLALEDTNVEHPLGMPKASALEVRAGRTFWVVSADDPV